MRPELPEIKKPRRFTRRGFSIHSKNVSVAGIIQQQINIVVAA